MANNGAANLGFIMEPIMTGGDAFEKRDSAVSFHIDDAGEATEIADLLGVEVAARFGPRDERPLAILARDGAGALVGGLNGSSHWRWLYVRHFFVAPESRGQGLGRRLMAQAEQIARERGCVGLYLDTFEEGAAAFYERCGFARCGRIENFPAGAARIYLNKALQGATPG
jgi:GNAT superfamily N-acetyltransferase